MVWQDPQNHFSDCYFCAVKTTGLTSTVKQGLLYNISVCHQQFNQILKVLNFLYQHSMVFSSVEVNLQVNLQVRRVNYIKIL